MSAEWGSFAVMKIRDVKSPQFFSEFSARNWCEEKQRLNEGVEKDSRNLTKERQKAMSLCHHMERETFVLCLEKDDHYILDWYSFQFSSILSAYAWCGNEWFGTISSFIESGVLSVGSQMTTLSAFYWEESLQLAFWWYVNR